MSRVFTGFAMAAIAMGAIGQASAADWPTGPDTFFRPAYPADMAPMEDSLDFEAGLRYFYGVGGQSFTLGGTTYSADDSSHSLELHGRIDDHSTSTYVKGHIGFGAITDGEYEPSGEDFNTGRVGYANADFGYTPLRTDGLRAGIFAGYMYADESPQNNTLTLHGLRLGVSTRAELSDVFDLNAEAAIVPYSLVEGTMYNPDATLTSVSGSLYGATAELMAGFRMSETFVVRAGARGHYLNGYVDSDQDERYVEMFRWGPVIELTGTF